MEETGIAYGGDGGKGRKMKRNRKVIALIAAAAVIAAGMGAGVMKWNQESTGGEMNQKRMSREGTVQKGELELTVSTSGTTTGRTSYQTYNAVRSGLVVAETAVASGDTVQKGDTLLTLTKESVAEAKTALQTTLVQCRAAYRQQKTAYEEAVLAAQKEYETNLSLNATAGMEYQDTIESAAQKVKSAKAELERVQTVLREYPDKIKRSKRKKAAESERLQEAERLITAWKELVEGVQKKQEKLQKSYDLSKTKREELATVKNYLDKCTQKGTDVESLRVQVGDEWKEAQKEEQKQQKLLQKAQKTYTEKKKKLTAYEKKSESGKKRLQSYEEQISSCQNSLEEAEKNLNSCQAAYFSALSEQKLEKTGAAAVYAKSSSQYRNAQSTYRTALREAKETLQKAKTAYQKAKKQKEALEELLDGNRICASRAGTISSMTYAQGDTLQAGIPLAGYLDSSVINIEVSVEQQDISALQVGSSVTVRLKASPEQLTGTVSAIETEASSDSVSEVSYTVTITVENADEKLALDETAMVSFSKGTVEDALYVPSEAVQREGSSCYVPVKGKDGTTEKVRVTTGEENGQFIEIKSGLEEGDTYVIEMES